LHDEILAAIAEIATERFGRTGELESGQLESSTRLAEDLGLDSLKLMEMAVAVENRFRIRIDEANEAEIVTIGDLIDIVVDQVSRRCESS
jgi:acyl carrier protein